MGSGAEQRLGPADTLEGTELGRPGRLRRLSRSGRSGRLGMMHGPVRSRVLAALAIAALVSTWPASLAAQVPSDLADALVRGTYAVIRDDALRPPDVLTLLHETVLTAQHALVAAGVTEPSPLPVFAGQEDRDLTA